MSDLISRQDALDAIQKRADIVTSAHSAFWEGLIIAYSLVQEIPSAEPERRWIPVTEALPKPWQEVLTTYEYNGKRFVQTAEYAGQNDEKGNPLFCACSDEFAPDHYDFVYVAWQPLPEPWRGE